MGDDDVYLEVHELARKRGEAIEFSFRRAPLNEDVFPLLVAELAQSLAKRPGAGRAIGKRVAGQIPYPGKFSHYLRRKR